MKVVETMFLVFKREGKDVGRLMEELRVLWHTLLVLC